MFEFRNSKSVTRTRSDLRALRSKWKNEIEQLEVAWQHNIALQNRFSFRGIPLSGSDRPYFRTLSVIIIPGRKMNSIHKTAAVRRCHNAIIIQNKHCVPCKNDHAKRLNMDILDSRVPQSTHTISVERIKS